MSAEDRARSLANLKLERDALALYEQLARIEKDERRAAAFGRIAANERRHAAIWAQRLEAAGVTVPHADAPRFRVRLIMGIARVFGTRSVSDLVRSLEGDEEDAYAEQAGPDVAEIAADEREHAEIWKRLDAGDAEPGASTEAELADPSPRPDDEAWHRAGQAGTLRAAIFGVNDGLVSNLSLVMGVTGANAGNHIIVLAGVAGLLAGAFSMAAGEYISMQSQRELFQRQIDLEREEMRVMPEAEEAELTAIFRRKGLSAADARTVASHLMDDPVAALDTKVREELGLDPEQLGSPWGAAAYSFVAFAVGAFVPLVPYLLSSGFSALLGALVLAFGALFLVGAGVSLLTGRSMLFSGARQVLIGATAAAVTFAVGAVIGIQAAG
ncbi:MAG: VIT1/CCC1 transporter family protein [Chloroflexi bacterium]|nr:VIT1/CCC1 transporter family protein [Chloroflexota bacterium]